MGASSPLSDPSPPRTVNVPLGVGEVRVKHLEHRQLLGVRDRHVVLDRVETAQHEVEDADRVLDLVRQLLNDDRKAAGHLVERRIAELPAGQRRVGERRLGALGHHRAPLDLEHGGDLGRVPHRVEQSLDGRHG
jgi:hypothetical protein